MRPSLAELGVKPTVRERLQGRSLRVPDAEGNQQYVRGVTTLQRSLIGPRRRTIMEPSDYGQTGDLAFGEVREALDKVIAEMGKERKVTAIKELTIPAFNTVATGFEIAQLGLYGKNPEGTIIYSNTAPRGKDHLGDIEWHGNDGQGFVFGILDTGVPILAVDAGHTFSFVKDRLIGLWKVNVPTNGTQFRSRDNFPDSLRILGGRKGKDLIGDWIDPQTIPNPPQVVQNEHDGSFALPVAYKDGYGNLKTAVRLSNISDDLRESLENTKELWITVTDEKGETKRFSVKNRLAGAEPKYGELFLTTGSSGPKDDGYVEVNQMFGDAGSLLGISELTDTTRITFEAINKIKSEEVTIYG